MPFNSVSQSIKKQRTNAKIEAENIESNNLKRSNIENKQKEILNILGAPILISPAIILF